MVMTPATQKRHRLHTDWPMPQAHPDGKRYGHAVSAASGAGGGHRARGAPLIGCHASQDEADALMAAFSASASSRKASMSGASRRAR